jgi:hypothetical protein
MLVGLVLLGERKDTILAKSWPDITAGRRVSGAVFAGHDPDSCSHGSGTMAGKKRPILTKRSGMKTSTVTQLGFQKPLAALGCQGNSQIAGA